MTDTVQETHPIEEYLTSAMLASELFGWGCKVPDRMFRTYQELILKRGRAYEGAPRPRGMRKKAYKQCYRNTTRLVFDHPFEYRYVEGYAMSPEAGLPVEHAWAIDKEDRVIDLTWKDPATCWYYGMEMPIDDVLVVICRNKVYGVLGNDYRQGAPLLRYGTILPPEDDACR